MSYLQSSYKSANLLVIQDCAQKKKYSLRNFFYFLRICNFKLKNCVYIYKLKFLQRYSESIENKQNNIPFLNSDCYFFKSKVEICEECISNGSIFALRNFKGEYYARCFHVR